MVISHVYQYIFVEIPLTGSWSIREYLCTYCQGMPVLHKHASYPEFFKKASKQERGYFVFATVRHPADEVVSRYYKALTDHKGTFSSLEAANRLIADPSDLRKYRFIKDKEATFEDYFRKYYKRMFNSMIDLSGNRLDFVLRFESLQEDFYRLLDVLGIEKKEPLDLTNKTVGRKTEWAQYYEPHLIRQAKQVFTPFMLKWGYVFPSTWGDFRVSHADKVRFYFWTKLRNLYFLHIRYSEKPYARHCRHIRRGLKLS